MALDTDISDEAPPAALAMGKVYEFKGQPLAAYSFGRRLIFRGLILKDENPVNEVFTLAVIYSLTLDDAGARLAIFNPQKAREGFFKWMDEFKAYDYPEAVEVAGKILDEVKAAEVSVAPSNSPAEKKSP